MAGNNDFMGAVVAELKILNETSTKALDRTTENEEFTKILAERMKALLDLMAASEGARLLELQQQALAAAERRKEAKGMKDGEKRKNGLILDGLLAAMGVAAAAGAIVMGVALAASRMRTDLDDAMTKTIEMVTGFFVSLNTIGFAKKVGSLINTMMFGIPSMINNAIRAAFDSKWFKTLRTNLFSPITRFIARLGNWLTPAKSSRRMLFDGIKFIFKWIGKISKFFVDIVKAIIPFKEFLGKLLGAVFRSLGKFAWFITLVIAIWDGMTAAFTEAGQQGSDAISVFVAFFRGAVNGFLTLITDLGEFFGWIVEKVMRMMGFSEEASLAVREAINGAAQWLEDWVIGLSNWFYDFVEAALRMFGGFFGENPVEGIGEVWDMLVGAWDSFWSMITGAFSGMVSFLDDAILWARRLNPGEILGNMLQGAGNLAAGTTAALLPGSAGAIATIADALNGPNTLADQGAAGGIIPSGASARPGETISTNARETAQQAAAQVSASMVISAPSNTSVTSSTQTNAFINRQVSTTNPARPFRN